MGSWEGRAAARTLTPRKHTHAERASVQLRLSTSTCLCWRICAPSLPPSSCSMPAPRAATPAAPAGNGQPATHTATPASACWQSLNRHRQTGHSSSGVPTRRSLAGRAAQKASPACATAGTACWVHVHSSGCGHGSGRAEVNGHLNRLGPVDEDGGVPQSHALQGGRIHAPLPQEGGNGLQVLGKVLRQGGGKNCWCDSHRT